MELYNTSSSISIMTIPWKGVRSLAYSEAQKEATSRYNKKAYDRIDLIVPKGKRRIIAEYAKSQGKSTNRFINEAIDKVSQTACSVVK